MFRYFLVSSQVHLEKNGLSEAAWILAELAGKSSIENFEAKLLPVGGLGLLINDQNLFLPDSCNELIDQILEKEKIHFCLKIIPLQYFNLLTDETVFTWLEEAKGNILPAETWKTTINKRHSKLDSQSLISQIANKISNKVDLKTPDKIIQVEVIGKYIGLSLLKPGQIIQLSSKIANNSQEISDENETDWGE